MSAASSNASGAGRALAAADIRGLCSAVQDSQTGRGRKPSKLAVAKKFCQDRGMAPRHHLVAAFVAYPCPKPEPDLLKAFAAWAAEVLFPTDGRRTTFRGKGATSLVRGCPSVDRPRLPSHTPTTAPPFPGSKGRGRLSSGCPREGATSLVRGCPRAAAPTSGCRRTRPPHHRAALARLHRPRAA